MGAIASQSAALFPSVEGLTVAVLAGVLAFGLAGRLVARLERVPSFVVSIGHALVCCVGVALLVDRPRVALGTQVAAAVAVGWSVVGAMLDVWILHRQTGWPPISPRRRRPARGIERHRAGLRRVCRGLRCDIYQRHSAHLLNAASYALWCCIAPVHWVRRLSHPPPPVLPPATKEPS
jgi:hypothetical protein